jgi:hypothetical protein
MSKSTAAGRELALGSRDVRLKIGETASVLPKSLLQRIIAMSNGDWPVGEQRHLAHRLWVLHGGRLILRDIESTRVCFEDHCAHSYLVEKTMCTTSNSICGRLTCSTAF